MSKVIAIANQKGGVGKTTCTYNLAAAKALLAPKKSILMLDLDPQGSLSVACGYNPEKIEDTISQALTGELNPKQCCYITKKHTELDNLTLLPSNLSLSEVENWLYSVRNPDVQLRKSTQILRTEFDYIFIDCPPQLGRLLSNALVAADEVIIPVKTDYLPYKGLKALMKTITDIQSADGDRSLNPDLEMKGIIATFYKSKSKDNQEILEALKTQYPVIGIIKDSVSCVKGIDEGKCCVIKDSKCEAAKEFFEIAQKL